LKPPSAWQRLPRKCRGVNRTDLSQISAGSSPRCAFVVFSSLRL
jgi:hypothetical protein